MKHTPKITLLLIIIFFAAQILGLLITSKYISIKETIDPATNVVVKEVVSQDLPYNIERPEARGPSSVIWIILAVIIGTILLLLLIKFKKISLWKLWFFLAVFFTLAIAFSAFIPETIAAILAFVLAIVKIYKPTVIIQNLTEIFIYGGLAAIFVPIFELFWVFALLILISIYDIIAVYKIKHMVTLAKFQTKSKVFAGLMVPYGKKTELISTDKKEKGSRIAVLGGGDIGFPLIFAGVVMKDLLANNIEAIALLKTLTISVFATIALAYLLFFSQKGRFYPAMPYLTVGCIAGYLVLLLFN